MHFVFIYPQLKNLTGAQRLILALAGAVTTLPDEKNGPNRVTILTHKVSPDCRAAIPPGVQLVETGFNLNKTRNHYFDSLLEYFSVPFLLRHIPKSDNEKGQKKIQGKVDAVCFFGPPSLPGLWWGKHLHRLKIPLLYFCYEPPRAAYTDISEVSRAWAGRLGGLVRRMFRLYRPLDRYLAKQADGVLVNGLYAQSLIRETYGLPSTVITHGVELLPLNNLEEAAQQVRTRHGLFGKGVILTVNHLHPRKRVDLQIKAMPLLLKEIPDAALLVVGSGPESANLRQLADQLGLTPQQVAFAGFVPDAELVAYYAAADLYFHSGRAESFGLSVLEASAAGLPIVAADEGGPRDIIIEGETGFLVQATPENFAAKASRLLNNPDMAKKMGQAGTESVSEKFTWAKGATNFVEAYTTGVRIKNKK